jgi:hypothetical protein
LWENAAETTIIEAVTGTRAISSVRVISDALTSGAPLRVLSPLDPAGLDDVELSEEAKLRIAQALSRNSTVMLAAPWAMGVEARTAWIEFDNVTGVTIGVTEHGGHSAFFEYFAVDLDRLLISGSFGGFVGFFTGQVVGRGCPRRC